MSAALAFKLVVQTAAAFANPADTACRNTCHQSIIRHILRHHGSCGNQSAAPDSVSAHDSAIGSQRCPFPHQCTSIYTMNRKMRPWCDHIGEHAARTAEDVVLQLHPFIQRDIVLDTHTAADPDIVPDIHVLPQ